jgi:hypothetical protein
MGQTLRLPAIRPPAHLTAEETDLSAAAIDAFTVAVGGRQQLLDTLAVANGAPDIDKVHRLLIDPSYAAWSLRKICRLAGLTVADLFVAYKKALIVRAHLEATQVIMGELVGVVQDVMARAQPQLHTCDTCHGTATYTPEPTKKRPNPEPIPCPTCKATGTVTEWPELDRQKVALELGQLLTSKAGILVQQNTLVAPGGGMGAPGPLETLQQAVQDVLYPRAVPSDRATTAEPPIDAEILAPEIEPPDPSAWPSAAPPPV